METSLINRIIMARFQIDHEVTMLVSGISMLPILREGDKITIRRMEKYDAGDIVAFLYKDNQILVHRLIMIKDNRYYIKGDNALRMEDVKINNILGKVVLINGKEIGQTPAYVVPLSHLVNRYFHKSGYNVLETMQSGIYRFYKQYITNICDDNLTYEKNGLVFFEQCKDNIDDLAIQIINKLDTPCDYKTLVTYAEHVTSINFQSNIHSNLTNILARGIVDGVVIVK